MHPATDLGHVTRIAVMLLALLSASCSTIPSWPENALTPARLNESKHDYNGEEVTVHGWMRSGFENYSLWESREASSKGEFEEKCVSLLIPQSMDTSGFDKQHVTVKGVFVEKLPSNVVQLGGCNLTTLILKEGAPPQALP